MAAGGRLPLPGAAGANRGALLDGDPGAPTGPGRRVRAAVDPALAASHRRVTDLAVGLVNVI